MFGGFSQGSGYRTETQKVKACGYDTVTEEVITHGDAKSGKGGTAVRKFVALKLQGPNSSTRNAASPKPAERNYIRDPTP